MKYRFTSLIVGAAALAITGQAMAAPNIVCRDDATGAETATWINEPTYVWCRVQDWDGFATNGTYDLDCENDGVKEVTGGVVNSGNDHDFGAFCTYTTASPTVVAKIDFYAPAAPTLVDSEQVILAVGGATPTDQMRVNQTIARGLKELYSRWVSGGEDGDFGDGSARAAGFNTLPFITKGTKPGKDAAERAAIDASRIYGEAVHTALARIQRSANIVNLPSGSFPNNAPGGNIEAEHGAFANGQLIWFDNSGYGHPIIALPLIASDPTTVAWDGPVAGRTFQSIVQDALDACYGSAKDGGSDRGGQRYAILSNQSHDGSAMWCALATNEAQINNPTQTVVPEWVKTDLANHNCVGGSGGYGYSCGQQDADLTPNLMQIYAIRGFANDHPSVVASMDFIDNSFPGNLISGCSTDQYGSFTLAKGMRGARDPADPSKRQVVDLFPNGTDWYAVLSQHLVDCRTASGNGEVQWTQRHDDHMGTTYGTGPLVEVLLRGLTDIPPTADAGGPYNYIATLETPVTLDGCDSFHQDADRNIVDYAWDVDGDEVVDFSEADCELTFEGADFYTDTGADYDLTITLTVTDDGASHGGTDLSDSDTALMTVRSGNPQLPPVADPGGPIYSGFIDEPITFDASGSFDPNDPAGPCGSPLEYRWDVTGDGLWDSGDQQQGPEGSWIPDATFDYAFSDPLSALVTLEVRDSCGAVGVSAADVTVSVALVAPIRYHVRALKVVSIVPQFTLVAEAAVTAFNGGTGPAFNIDLEMLNGPPNWTITDGSVVLLPAAGLAAGAQILSDGPDNAASSDQTFSVEVNVGAPSLVKDTFWQVSQENEFGDQTTYQAAFPLLPSGQ